MVTKKKFKRGDKNAMVSEAMKGDASTPTKLVMERIRIAHGTRVNYSLIAQVRKRLTKETKHESNGHGAVPVPSVPGKVEMFQCEIRVPGAGAVIKLGSTTGRALGTLHADQEGISFVKANTKKRSDRKLPWEVLHRLFELGLLK